MLGFSGHKLFIASNWEEFAFIEEVFRMIRVSRKFMRSYSWILEVVRVWSLGRFFWKVDCALDCSIFFIVCNKMNCGQPI